MLCAVLATYDLLDFCLCLCAVYIRPLHSICLSLIIIKIFSTAFLDIFGLGVATLLLLGGNEFFFFCLFFISFACPHPPFSFLFLGRRIFVVPFRCPTTDVTFSLCSNMRQFIFTFDSAVLPFSFYYL